MIDKRINRIFEKYKSKFFTITFWSYTLISVLLVLFSFAVNYFFLYAELKKEIEVSQDAMISMFRKDVNSQFQHMHQIVSLIQSDPEMIEGLADNDYAYYKNSKTLASYLSINDHLIDLFIYDEADVRVCSTIGGVSKKDYFNTYFHYDKFPPSDIFSFLNAVHSKTISPFFPLSYYRSAGKVVNCTLYIVPVSETRKIVFVLQDTVFLESLRNYFADEEFSLVLLDAHQNELLSLGRSCKIDSLLLEEFIKEDSFVKTQKMNTGYITLISGFYNNWYYYLFYNFSNYSDTIRSINMVFGGFFVLLLVIGVGLSYSASNFSSKPIRNIYQAIPLTESAGRQNELKAIETYLQTVTAHNLEISRKLENEYPLMLCTMINSVMNGSISYRNNEKVFKNSCYAIKYKWFSILVYNGMGEYSAYTENLIIEKAAKKKDNICIIPVKNWDDRIVSVIINATDCDILKKFLADFGNEIVSKCPDNITVGIGPCYESTDYLAASYSCALIALSTTSGDSRISFYSQVDKPIMQSHMTPFRECKQYIQNFVSKKDISALTNYIKKTLSASADAELRMFYYSNILSELWTLCEQYNVPLGDFDRYLLIPHYSIKEMINNIDTLTLKLFSGIENLSQESDRQLIRDILQYITDHVANPDLNAQMIADHFGYSVSYVNKYFKALMEITPTTFIDNKRLQMAEELVINTNLQIKDICRQVGYMDINNFIRKFKKIYGLAPLQFRNEKRNT